MKKRRKRLPNFYYEKKLWKQGLEVVAGLDEVGRGCFAGPIVAAAVALPPINTSQFTIRNKAFDISDTFDTFDTFLKINDSKKLTDKQRRISDKWIRKNCLTYGIGSGSVAEINKYGMGKAARKAFRRAVASANTRLQTIGDRQWTIERQKNLKLKKEKKAIVHRPSFIDYLLIDAFYISHIPTLPVLRRNHKTKKNSRAARKNHTNHVGTTQSRQLAINNGDEKSISIAAASILAKVYRDDLMIKLGKKSYYKKYDWSYNKGYATKRHREAILKYGVTKHHRERFVRTFLANN